MVRVLKLQLEANIGAEINMSEPIMKWMVRWAAMMLSRFRTSTDNKTAYEKQTGRRCQIEVVPFAEKVWYRKLSQEDGNKAVMSSRWEEGIWLGHCRNSNEVWIGTPAGAVKAWSVRRRAQPERWDKHFIAKVKATPKTRKCSTKKTPSQSPMKARMMRNQMLRKRRRRASTGI